MRNLIIFLSAILLSTSSAFATSKTHTFDNFGKVFEFIETEVEANGSESLLVVFDLDRTVINSYDCSAPGQEFDDGYDRFLFMVWNCHSTLTSPILPIMMDRLKAKNIPVMALTARGAWLLEPTLEQLTERLWFSEGVRTNSSVTFETAPLFSGEKRIVEFEQQGASSMLQKKLEIRNGVAMATGADKGLGLQAFTKLVEETEGRAFDRLIFVDDDMDNIENLMEAYSETEESMSVIHYTEHEKVEVIPPAAFVENEDSDENN